jgi:glutaredoxin
MADAPLPDLVLYSRAGCHLCDEARELLQALLDERARQGLTTPRLDEIDIESDPELERRFFTTIPVVELGDRRVELATSAAKLRRLLADVLDGSPATTSA